MTNSNSGEEKLWRAMYGCSSPQSPYKTHGLAMLTLAAVQAFDEATMHGVCSDMTENEYQEFRQLREMANILHHQVTLFGDRVLYRLAAKRELEELNEEG